ncbi:hypothetical protein [Pseudogulbenkiania subflava]|uniref:Uncharacterized protein n=1 Tax=Pseudogulbenkiania subflava DSM 22618 TaxID=1123014 RepID=A0A1Y6BI35_9NEIS|nr:hypothetical protein [Pseudogulbenkiania subflava]SMF04025.1 hypothetical protein SAMN02745746_00920 [Pseudogulbenkiania subflava DSM 22618]
MATLYQADDSTLIGCYQEAMALADAMATLIPASILANLPRRGAAVHFKYRDDGEIDLIFMKLDTTGETT